MKAPKPPKSISALRSKISAMTKRLRSLEAAFKKKADAAKAKIRKQSELKATAAKLARLRKAA